MGLIPLQYHSNNISGNTSISTMKETSAVKLWGCAICEREFYTKREMEKHTNKYHLGYNATDSVVKSAKKQKVTSDTNCVKCDMNFQLPSELERHTEILHGDGHRKEEEKVGNSLELSKETDIGQGCYLCVSCGMEFSSLGEQKQHMAMHREVWGGEAMPSHTMERKGMTPSTKSLLRENTELKRELQESNWKVSKLKTMLKQSRMKVRDLEAERSKREFYDDFDKEIESLETSIPSQVVVKQEFDEQNGPNAEKVSDMVSQMDHFLKQINRTEVLNSTQSEDNKSNVTLNEINTSTSTEAVAINEPKKKKKITNEIIYGNAPILKSKSKSLTCDIEDKVKKRSDGKYECNDCNHKHVSQNQVTYHIMSQHKGHTWDCNVCGKKYGSPYQLNIHKRDKHISTDPEALCLDNDKIEPKLIKKMHTQLTTKFQSSSIKKVDGKFQCPHCIVESKYKSYMKMHIKNKHEEQKLKHLEIENKLHNVLQKYLE